MMVAIANRTNLADQAVHDEDEPEGMERAPCGSPSKGEPTCFCIREVPRMGPHG